MVNKREKIYCIISISDKRLSSFFISLILSLSFYTFFLFHPTFFVLILSYLSRTCAFFFCCYIWAERSLLFWTFLSGTIFAGGGGGARAPSAPPLRTRLLLLASGFFKIFRKHLCWKLYSMSLCPHPISSCARFHALHA